ncbi:hypothetical protein O0L34_g12543 [Tuta absoluta]|nr:hypothetical protein O0L34_g12543 [Tuta absoluta]
MARKYMERRFSKSHRTTIPASFKVPEPHEFYNKATPFVQRTLLFVADENSGPKPSCSGATGTTVAVEPQDGSSEETAISSVSKPDEQEKSPKKSSFFFSPSKSCKHGRSFFRLPTSPKKSKSSAEGEGAGKSAGAAGAAGAAGGAGLISYAPGWSLKGEHLMKWQASGKTTIEVR